MWWTVLVDPKRRSDEEKVVVLALTVMKMKTRKTKRMKRKKTKMKVAALSRRASRQKQLEQLKRDSLAKFAIIREKFRQDAQSAARGYNSSGLHQSYRNNLNELLGIRFTAKSLKNSATLCVVWWTGRHVEKQILDGGTVVACMRSHFIKVFPGNETNLVGLKVKPCRSLL